LSGSKVKLLQVHRFVYTWTWSSNQLSFQVALSKGALVW